jgi:hypothetical protein
MLRSAFNFNLRCYIKELLETEKDLEFLVQLWAGAYTRLLFSST